MRGLESGNWLNDKDEFRDIYVHHSSSCLDSQQQLIELNAALRQPEPCVKSRKFDIYFDGKQTQTKTAKINSFLFFLNTI